MIRNEEKCVSSKVINEANGFDEVKMNSTLKIS